jgi:CheY-like chemotaxis protein
MTATTMLQKLGHSVVVANHGREALDKLDREDFDIVFMDVQMPEMDGMTATRLIREREQTDGTHIPIVAMTAHAMKGDKDKCLQAGMDDYVSKPVRRKELAAVLQRIGQRFLQPTAPERGASAAFSTSKESDMVLDEEALMEECDNDKELLAQMFEIFERDSQGRIERLREAIQGGNAEVVRQEAHALKGGLGTFFADAVFETAYQLESMGERADLAEAESTFQTLLAQLQQLKSKLTELLAP